MLFASSVKLRLSLWLLIRARIFSLSLCLCLFPFLRHLRLSDTEYASAKIKERTKWKTEQFHCMPHHIIHSVNHSIYSVFRIMCINIFRMIYMVDTFKDRNRRLATQLKRASKRTDELWQKLTMTMIMTMQKKSNGVMTIVWEANVIMVHITHTFNRIYTWIDRHTLYDSLKSDSSLNVCSSG